MTIGRHDFGGTMAKNVLHRQSQLGRLVTCHRLLRSPTHKQVWSNQNATIFLYSTYILPMKEWVRELLAKAYRGSRDRTDPVILVWPPSPSLGRQFL